MTNTAPGILSQDLLNGDMLLDTCEGKPVYLYAASNGSHIRLTSSAFWLLKAVGSGLTFEQLASSLNHRPGENKISAEKVEAIYHSLVERISNIEKQPAEMRLPSGFWLRWRIFPENIVWRISALLSVLYKPLIAGALLTLTMGVFLALHRSFLVVRAGQHEVMQAYLLFLVSIMFHEFGHASACARFGLRPAEIGFSFYLIYPAFYSDVSAVWRLRRLQRVVVDLGGAYFQFMAGALFLLAYRFTGYVCLKLAVLLIIYASAFSLNPIFKFDGYWIVADLLGVTNLGSQPWRIAKSLLRRACGLPFERLPWPSGITYVLVAYSVVSFGVWALFLRKIIPVFSHNAFLFSRGLEAIFARISLGKVPTWSDIWMFVVSTFLLTIWVVMIWRLGARCYALLLKSFNRYVRAGEAEKSQLRAEPS